MANKFLQTDIEELVSYKKYFEPFNDSTFLVTGATGLIGSILIKSLLHYSKMNNIRINVYAACRSKEKFEKVFEDYICENLHPLFSDIQELDISDLQLDYVVHGASVTDSKAFVESPVEIIETAFEGTNNLLKQFLEKKESGQNIKGFVYLSSLEVYGTFHNETNDSNDVKNVNELDSGYINTLSVRSSYSESKRMVETLCVSYASEYNIPVKIARLCQTFGAGVNYNDNRVFAQFARSIIEHKDIVLKTKGETVRNYCYTTDAISGILTVLLKGNIGEAYNIANPDTTISIVDMAKLFCELFPDSQSKVIFDIADNVEKLGYNPVVKLSLDSTKLRNLDWNPKVSLNGMLIHLVNSMK